MEEYRRIEKLLQTVPDDQAEIIRLRVLDNLSFIEIAGLLVIPVTTVKSRFKYGIDKLKLVLHPKETLYEL
jgi:RNA polymerase sigma-70 factor (ECF subfamily)